MIAWLRKLLGLDELASMDQYKALEKAERERHKELMAAVEDLGKRLEAAHVFEPLKPAPKRWDVEQLEALALQKAIDEDANRKDSDA